MAEAAKFMRRRPLARHRCRARRPLPGTGYKFLVTQGTTHTLPAAAEHLRFTRPRARPVTEKAF